ncbi:capsid scaffold protein [Human betaherpesvirus 5]|nr:capsid scaffold protein [Human betaherpesvirus 5]
MSHPLSAAVTAATAPPGATVVGASPAVPSLAWPHDGVYLPKDAFFSLLGASRSAAPVMYPGAVAAPPSASPAPLPLPSYPAPYGAPVVGYDQLAARHFAEYVDPHYPGWGRRYEPAPPLHSACPVPPPPSPAYYRRRDSPGGMDEPPSGWERYDGGHRGQSQKQHRHGGSGGHNKRRKEAAASSSSDEDLSFPGEAEHGRARKRLKSHVNSDGGSGGHAGSNQQQQQRYDELRDAIHELKRDLFAARQSSTLLSAALPAAASSSPTTTTVCTPTGELTSGGGETPTALLSGGAKVAERAQAGVVNASCRLATASGSETATAGPSTAGSSSCPASVVLAAAAAQAAAASQSPPKDMVDLNRRIFVAALNKLE